MSYIEREAVLDRLAKVNMDTYYGFTAAVQFGVDHAIQCIKEEPAADVAPVRHGRWIELSRASKCSECRFETGRYEPPRRYCPECGARMDGEGAPTCRDGVCDIPGVEQKEGNHVE